MAANDQVPEHCPRCRAELDTTGTIGDPIAARLLKFSALPIVVIVTLILHLIGHGTGWFEDGWSMREVAICVLLGMAPAVFAFGFGAAMKQVRHVACGECRWKSSYRVSNHETIRLMVDA